MQDKRAQALDEIRKLIFSGGLPPGSQTSERVLGEKLQMSRPPIREALAILEYLGLVIQHPQKGVEIRVVECAEAIEVLRLQRSLEVDMLDEFTADDGISPELNKNLDAMRHAVNDPSGFLTARRSFHRAIAFGAHFRNAAVAIGAYEDRTHLFRCRLKKPLTRLDAQTIATEHENILNGLANNRTLAQEALTRYFQAETTRIDKAATDTRRRMSADAAAFGDVSNQSSHAGATSTRQREMSTIGGTPVYEKT
jgi:DNA-binding GntR family transcriptional regulator